jgi:SAM-dependent methyltransferase
MNEWHDNDSFWIDMAPKMFPKNRWEGTGTEIDCILALLEIQKDDIILDLGCGPGRHTLELARRGYNVTGFDRTRDYLDKLKEKADKQKLKINIIHDDMRNLSMPGTYNACLNLFTTFGYFGTDEENFQVLKNIYQSLKKDGKILIDIVGKEIIARIFRERDWHEEEGVIYLEERRIDDEWKYIKNRWIKMDGSNRIEYNISLRIYSGMELSELIKRAGFSNLKLYGSLDGAPYNQDAERLIITAQR